MRIAVSAMGSTNDEMISSMNRIAEARADIIELRLDFLKEKSDLEELLSEHIGIPKIVTYRSTLEGGKNSNVTEDERLAVFQQSIDLGADYIDVEFTSGLYKQIEKVSTKLIVSYHDFSMTPDLNMLYDKIARTSADIVKIATHAQTRTDSLKMLELINQVSMRHGKPIIGICMGPEGMITREWGPAYGSYLTFASIDDKTASAPGQISIDKLRENWKALGLTE